MKKKVKSLMSSDGSTISQENKRREGKDDHPKKLKMPSGLQLLSYDATDDATLRLLECSHFAPANQFLSDTLNNLGMEFVSYRPKMCGHCKKRATATTKKCSRCKIVYYCNVECQRLHWAFHKPNCTAYLDKHKVQ